MRKSALHALPAVIVGCGALFLSLAGCNRAPSAPPKTLELSADDKMKFSTTALEAVPGQQVTVTLSNKGTSPKASMGHNFVLLNKGVNWNQFVENASMDAAHDYVPPASARDVIAHTKLLGPGESDSVTFTAPYVPGDYDFACTFPGHATQGMKGTFTVKAQ